MAVKTSILVFYLTLTRGEKLFKLANYVTLAVVNLAGVALTLVNVFQCTPVSAAFLSNIPASAHCTDIVTLYLSSAPVNIITDLAILFLPMPILTKLHLPRKQKLILVVTFGFGFFVAVVDVIRIAFLQRAAISRQLAIKAVHISKIGSLDFSCTPLQSESEIAQLIVINRGCVTIVHVVRRRSQCIGNLWLRPEFEAARWPTPAEAYQGH